LGGDSLLFYGSSTGHIEKRFAAEEHDRQGHSLSLGYRLDTGAGYVGYVSFLQYLDLRDFQILSVKIKTTEGEGHQDLVLGIKDRAGGEGKVEIGSFLSAGITSEWKTALIPLGAFQGIIDWGHIENISLSFEGRLSQRGTVYIDDIECHKHFRALMIDDFERPDRKNRLGRGHWTFASGVAVAHGQPAKASPNTVHRLSYGGVIGVGNVHDRTMKSFSGWLTELGGLDCSGCEALSFKIRGFEGNECFTVYLSDGAFRWGCEVGSATMITTEWQEVILPLSHFSEYGVDLSHVTDIQFSFEGERMSGALDIDDIQLITTSD
jgi:hypothetical protein